LVRDPRLSPTWTEDIAPEKGEPTQYAQDVLPFLGMRCRQDGQPVTPFANLVTLFDVGKDKGLVRHKAIVCAYSSQRQALYDVPVMFSSAIMCPDGSPDQKRGNLGSWQPLLRARCRQHSFLRRLPDGPFRFAVARSLRRCLGGCVSRLLGFAERSQPGGLFPFGAEAGFVFRHRLGGLASLHFLFLEISFGPLQGLL